MNIQALQSLITQVVRLGSGNNPVAQIGMIKMSMVAMNINPPQTVKILPSIFLSIIVFLDEPVNWLFADFGEIFVCF